MSQKSELITLMQSRWITPLEALHLCGCLSLSQRITEIKLGLVGSGMGLVEEWREVGKKRVKAFMIKQLENK